MDLNIFRAGRVAGSGLKTSRQWMNIISNNVANADTVDTGRIGRDGNYIPYARQVPVFKKVLSERFRDARVNGDVLNGVAVKEVAELEGKIRKVYDPTHPAARRAGTEDAGYVYYPGVSIAQEMADMRMAAAAYEANLSVMSTGGKMTQQALRIGRRG